MAQQRLQPTSHARRLLEEKDAGLRHDKSASTEIVETRAATEERDRRQHLANAEHDALEAEIEGLLSANPREFVLRFIQTVGQ